MLNITATLRRLIKDKLFTVINLGGLAVGIACFLLITLYLQQELTFDRHHAGAERIYRIGMTIRPPDGNPDIVVASNAPQVAPLLLEDFPEVAASTRLAAWQPSVRVEGGEPMHLSALLADNSVSTLFDFSWLAGDTATALTAPNSVVLTASAANRLFGRIDVLGETVTMAGVPDAQVSGVVRDPPVTTHLQFDLLVPMALAPAVFSPNALENWSNQIFHTYVMLRPQADIVTLEAQFTAFIAKHVDAEASRFLFLDAMPLLDLHLRSNRRGELGRPGSTVAVSAFGVIAIVVLLLACINFMNLATAKAGQRGREVGVRKAIGAQRSQLVRQFFTESLLFSALAALLALALVEMVLPFFNGMLQQPLELGLADPLTWLAVAAVTIVVGILAGLYPAFYVSAQRPNVVLRGLFAGGRAGGMFRSALVVLQFAAAVALLVCTATVFSQLRYAQRQDVGYTREQVVVLSSLGREGVGQQWDAMKQQLLAVPGVTQVTAMNNAPTQSGTSSYFLNFEGGEERRSTPTMLVDAGFFETFDIQVVAGQGFANSAAAAQGSYVLSEDAARRLGWTPQQAVGKWLELTCCGMPRGSVIGVVADVRYGSARSGLTPMLYVVPPDPQGFITPETRLGLRQIAIRLQGNDVQTTLAGIEQVWKQFRADQPLTRSFVSDDFTALYSEDARQGNMLIAFSVLAIFITCLGLYGLATFNAQRRTKEIGVRKVMGGSVWSIVVLLTNDFSKLVLLSNVIAWPIAWFAMNSWLQNFAYRIDLAPLIFVGSSLIALCVAWVTVGSIAAKAASAKPVLALRYE